MGKGVRGEGACSNGDGSCAFGEHHVVWWVGK